MKEELIKLQLDMQDLKRFIQLMVKEHDHLNKKYHGLEKECRELKRILKSVYNKNVELVRYKKLCLQKKNQTE